MENTNHLKKGVILLFIILISINLAGSVFATTPKVIHGLKSANDPNQIDVVCFYDDETNRCILERHSQTDSFVIVDEASIYVEDVDNPNLVINSNVYFFVFCDKNSNNGIVNNYSNSDPQPNFCVYEDANLNITNFNSIIISNNKSLNIIWPKNSYSKIKGNIIIPSGSQFQFRSNLDINRCIDVDSDNPNFSAELDLPVVDFSEAKIDNNGEFIVDTYTEIYAATKTDDANLCSTGGKKDPSISLEVNKKEIIFGDVNNDGNMSLRCIAKEKNSLEDVILNEPICDITFNNFSGNLPKIYLRDFSEQHQNNGIVKLSTCATIDVLPNTNYSGVCRFIYIRDSNNYTPITGGQLGIYESAIISGTQTCRGSNISDHIAHYLFTSDSNITSTPIIFGTINSAITYNPLDVSINTEGNAGLYNTKNLNQRISKISQTENTFFKLFLQNSNSIDTNLLDSYLFRFKLDRNLDMGYSDINLEYPFKIHK